MLLRDADLPAHVTLHGARHTFVDLLYATGTQESTTMDIAGHSVRSVTRGYRVNKDHESMIQAITAAGDLLTG